MCIILRNWMWQFLGCQVCAFIWSVSSKYIKQHIKIYLLRGNFFNKVKLWFNCVYYRIIQKIWKIFPRLIWYIFIYLKFEIFTWCARQRVSWWYSLRGNRWCRRLDEKCNSSNAPHSSSHSRCSSLDHIQ